MEKINTLPLEKRYRPTSGSEGDAFMVDYCWDCTHNDDCEIQDNSVIYEKHEDS